MIIKALLDMLGLRAPPPMHNDAVHAARNDAAASLSGFRMVVRQAGLVSRRVIDAPEDTDGAERGIENLRDTLAAVANRAREHGL